MDGPGHPWMNLTKITTIRHRHRVSEVYHGVEPTCVTKAIAFITHSRRVVVHGGPWQRWWWEEVMAFLGTVHFFFLLGGCWWMLPDM